MTVSRCRFCGVNLETIFADLGMSPLANAYLDSAQLNQMEPFYPLRVYVCENCLLVQLEAFASPQGIFSDYAYFSSYSKPLVQQAKEYTHMMMDRFALNENTRVVEIGSNDGYLLQHFVENGFQVLGIEPAANVAEEATKKGIPTLVKFFGHETAYELVVTKGQADLIVGNNVLAHIPDLNDFVKGMKSLLGPQGIITMEFHYLVRLIEEKQFDSIYHEHFSYFTLTSVQKVFESHGFVLFDVEQVPTHGGSLRIYTRHAEDDSKPISLRVLALLNREKEAGYNSLDHYLKFSEKLRETKYEILDFLIEIKRKGKIVAGYGAPAKGTTLLNYCGISSDFIEYAVDLSPHKQGRFLPGTHIPIYHPDKVKNTQPDYLLIMAWNLKDEIMQQMSFIQEWGGRFIVLTPEVAIYP